MAVPRRQRRTQGKTDFPRRKKLVNGADVPMQSDPSVELDGCWLGGGAGETWTCCQRWPQGFLRRHCPCFSLLALGYSFLPHTATNRSVALKRSFIHLSFAQAVKSGLRDDGELGRHLPCEFIPSYSVPSYTTLTHIESDCTALNERACPPNPLAL